jgi:predicted CXXCH cytochrome family protein
MDNIRAGAMVVFFLAGVFGLSMASCLSVNRIVVTPVEIEGAHFVGNQACVDCHETIVRMFPSSPHGQFHREDLMMAGSTGCESCHGAGSRHVAAGGGLGQFIINPGRDPAICYQCHLSVHAEFRLPQRHPVVEGIMNCVDCHDPHGPDMTRPAGGLAMARLNAGCAQCHQEQGRTFVFEHEALREGCTICHAPHGAMHRKLLHEPNNNLCLKCHAQVQLAPGRVVIGKVDHTALLPGRTCWSAGCHTSVHGSQVSRNLFY